MSIPDSSKENNTFTGEEKALIALPKQHAVVNSTAYGKGKVIARRKGGSGRLAFPPAQLGRQLAVKQGIRLAFQSSDSQSERFLLRKGYVTWLENGSLESLDLRRMSHGEAAWKLLRGCQPAHITSSGIAGQLIEEMDLGALESDFEAGPGVKARVCICKESTFMECNEEKNVFGSFYHVREPRTKISVLPLSTASRHLRQWQDRGIFLKIALKSLLASEENGTDFQLRQSPECSDTLYARVENGVDWEWLQQLRDRHRMGGVIAADLEVGGHDSLLPAQYAIRDRILIQVRGTRRVLVIDPAYSFKGLYPFPVHHPYDTYSMVDWEDPNTEEWLMSRGVNGRVCILKPGDILFVPSSWWLIQQLCGGENIVLTVTLGLSQRVKPLPALALRVSRNVEEILADLEGPGRILYWLNLLCSENERNVIDTWTVRGYEQIVAVWEARDDVDAVMGRKAWKALFAAMCEGRLKPTPWLNKDFVEPLYLKDKPRQIEDTRTDEQRRYPELFRHVKF